MSLGHTWTLWQRMPPRYQLTSQGVEEYVDNVICNSPDNAGSPRMYPTPRPQSASVKGNISLSNHEHDNNENKPARTESPRQRTSQTASFPRRNSDYVNHFQTQQKVSSARRRLAEAPPTPAIRGPARNAVLMTPKQRAQTAPAFPVTSPEFHKEQKRNRDIERYIRDNNNLTYSLQNKAKSRIEASSYDVFHFDDSKSVKSIGSYLGDSESVPRKYMVQETDDAVMFIDKGKVNYFKKSRHDLTNLLKTQSLRADRGNCFIADLRRDYLKHPKYSQRRPSDKIYKQSLTDPRVISSERVNYNNRLENILKYYSDNEKDPNQDRSRPTSARGSPIKGLSLTGSVSRPPSRESSASPERPDSPNDYIKLHKRSKLHNRQFYLRTPSQQHAYSTKEFESCRCCMCRVELQLALVTGVPSDIALAATKSKAPVNPVSFNEKPALSRSKSDGAEKTTQTDKMLHEASAKQTTRVTFQQPEVRTNLNKAKPKEHTLTISCTLPDMTDMAMSEAGLDTSRTNEGLDTSRVTPIN